MECVSVYIILWNGFVSSYVMVVWVFMSFYGLLWGL